MSEGILGTEVQKAQHGPPPGSGRWPLLRFFLGRYRFATAGVLLALFFSSIAESVGLLALLPLLNLVLDQNAGESSRIGRILGDFLGLMGLQVTLLTILGFIVSVVVIKSGFWLIAQRHIGYTAARIMSDLRQTMMRAILHAKWTYFTNQRTGIFANAMSTEADRASSTFMAFSNLLAHGLHSLLLLTAAFLVNWQISLAAIGAGFVMLVLLRSFIRISRHSGERITSLHRSLLSRVTDAMLSIKTLKSMGQEERLVDLLGHDIDDMNLMHRRLVMAKSWVRAAQEVIIVLAIAVGAFLAIANLDWPFSELLVTAVLFQRTMVSIGQLQSDYQSMLNTESGLWAATSLVREAENCAEHGTGAPPPPNLSEIRLENVSFAYGDTPLLQNASLVIPGGQICAIVGPSGAGKTTLIDLICRLLEPDTGRIKVNDAWLDEIDAHAWRNRIGYVPQETVLFHDTILRNVTLGDPDIAREEVERCLRQAGAWEFVAAFEDGVDTVVGERGSRLSGGQRQRIAITRALARRPLLLVLDEATASLDPETEREICATLAGLAGSMTLLAISHSTAINEISHIVYSIEEGHIVDTTPGTLKPLNTATS